jgi:hypothetical protein
MAPKGSKTGTFVNLLVITRSESVADAEKIVFEKGNIETGAIQRPSKFEHKAYCKAEGYVTSYR